MNILKLISSNNFITVNRELILKVGLEEAIMLGELASEFDYWLKHNGLVDGYFFSTIENIEKNTTLTEYKQRKALKHLQELNLVDCKVKGLPAKRYIKINEAGILALLTDKKPKQAKSTVDNKQVAFNAEFSF